MASDEDGSSGEPNTLPAEDTPTGNTGATYPSHTGRHEITAEDNYWAWQFSVNAPFVLEYTVTNLLDSDRDFDVLLYPPSKFETYRAIATGREEGIRPAYLDGSRPGTRTEAAATVDLSAGTYYLVVDNTDLSDAGDFGTESPRRVRVDATTRER